MEESKNSSRLMTLHQRSKTIVMQDHVLSPHPTRSKSVVKQTSRTLPHNYFSSVRRKELLKTYDIKQCDIPIQSPIFSRFPSLQQSRNSVSVNTHVTKGKKDRPLLKRPKKTYRRIDSDQTYLLDEIIVDYMYLNAGRNCKTELNEDSLNKNNITLPPIQPFNKILSVRSSTELYHASKEEESTKAG